MVTCRMHDKPPASAGETMTVSEGSASKEAEPIRLLFHLLPHVTCLLAHNASPTKSNLCGVTLFSARKSQGFPRPCGPVRIHCVCTNGREPRQPDLIMTFSLP